MSLFPLYHNFSVLVTLLAGKEERHLLLQ